GVRHLEHGGDAAQDRSAPAAGQVFLVLQARFAQVDLGIDDTGQDGQAVGGEALGGSSLAEVAKGGNAPGADADIDPCLPTNGSRTADRATVDDQVERFIRHRSSGVSSVWTVEWRRE